MQDKIKLATAVLLVAGGIVGFYYYAEQALLYRVLVLLALIGVSIGIALTSQLGANTLDFGRGAILEVRKSVWPTRKETLQTTGLVVATVIFMGVLLWLFDMFLGWGYKSLLGLGG